MKKLFLILSGCYIAHAQVIDNIKYIWRPGFVFSPVVSMLSNKAYSKEAIFQTGFYTTSNDFDKVNDLSDKNIAYGVKANWNIIFFRQWFNSAEVSYEFMKPSYGTKVANVVSGDKTYTTGNSQTAGTSFHMRAQDVLLHANHTWGSVLPYMGIGIEVFKVGGHLAYTKGAKYTSQELYIPVGSIFQMSPTVSGKIQLNLPLTGKTKYSGQAAPETKTVSTTTPESYTATFAYNDAIEYNHDGKTSIGVEGSFLFALPMMGSGTTIEPYFSVWHFDKKDAPQDFTMRWRSFGIRANMIF